ncbi:MAG: hypothetical protein AAF390_09665 [Pseudomonadota bacterium]
MPNFENQPARNAFHGRLKDIADATRDAKSDRIDGIERDIRVLTEKAARQDGWKDLIDAQAKHIAALTDRLADHDRWEWRQEHRLRALEARHRHQYWHLHPWVPRVLMYGISPSSLRFNASEPAVRGLRKAGYESVQDLVAVTSDGDRTPAKVVHAALAKLHEDDPDNVPAPPDPEEVEDVMTVAQQLIEQKGT